MQGLKAIRESKAAAARDEAKRYALESVAAAIGVSKPTLIAYEQDPARLNRDKAERLAEYLGCSVDDIFLPNE